jgi:hypothetical protein
MGHQALFLRLRRCNSIHCGQARTAISPRAPGRRNVLPKPKLFRGNLIPLWGFRQPTCHRKGLAGESIPQVRKRLHPQSTESHGQNIRSRCLASPVTVQFHRISDWLAASHRRKSKCEQKTIWLVLRGAAEATPLQLHLNCAVAICARCPSADSPIPLLLRHRRRDQIPAAR